jgi:DNA-binding response OmpR family regulator
VGKRVLVVDDDPDILLYLDTLLGDHGYEVFTADSTASAGEALATTRFDLLLLDVLLQGRSGLDLLLSLRKDTRSANLPVVLLTGDDRVIEDRGRSYLAQGAGRGADALLGKPVQPDALLATLRQLLPD